LLAKRRAGYVSWFRSAISRYAGCVGEKGGVNAGAGQFICWNFGAGRMILFMGIGKKGSESFLLQKTM
jgi:hypothetical protein